MTFEELNRKFKEIKQTIQPENHKKLDRLGADYKQGYDEMRELADNIEQEKYLLKSFILPRCYPRALVAASMQPLDEVDKFTKKSANFLIDILALGLKLRDKLEEAGLSNNSGDFQYPPEEHVNLKTLGKLDAYNAVFLTKMATPLSFLESSINRLSDGAGASLREHIENDDQFKKVLEAVEKGTMISQQLERNLAPELSNDNESQHYASAASASSSGHSSPLVSAREQVIQPQRESKPEQTGEHNRLS